LEVSFLVLRPPREILGTLSYLFKSPIISKILSLIMKKNNNEKKVQTVVVQQIYHISCSGLGSWYGFLHSSLTVQS
jgi:hypothetical protein